MSFEAIEETKNSLSKLLSRIERINRSLKIGQLKRKVRIKKK